MTDDGALPLRGDALERFFDACYGVYRWVLGGDPDLDDPEERKLFMEDVYRMGIRYRNDVVLPGLYTGSKPEPPTGAQAINTSSGVSGNDGLIEAVAKELYACAGNHPDDWAVTKEEHRHPFVYGAEAVLGVVGPVIDGLRAEVEGASDVVALLTAEIAAQVAEVERLAGEWAETDANWREAKAQAQHYMDGLDAAHRELADLRRGLRNATFDGVNECLSDLGEQ